MKPRRKKKQPEDINALLCERNNDKRKRLNPISAPKIASVRRYIKDSELRDIK